MFVSNPTLNEVRDLYRQSAKSEKTCMHMIEVLKNFDESNHPLFAGYRASAVMMMAQYTSNPFQKWSYFSRGKKLLEKAIAKSPQNIELRCLRFAVQANVPEVAGYKGDLERDKRFIIKNYAQVQEPALRKNIQYFMDEWGNLTPEERQKLD